MKNIVKNSIGILTMAMMSACNNVPSGQFLIDGKAPEGVNDGAIVTLQEIFNGQEICETTIKNGKFELRGNVDTIPLVWMSIEDEENGYENGYTVFIESGKIKFDDISLTSGTPLNDDFSKYFAIPIQNAQSIEEQESIVNNNAKILFDRHKGDALGEMMFNILVQTLTYDETLELLKDAPESLTGKEDTKQILKNKKAAQNTTKGKKYIDVKCLNLTPENIAKEHKLIAAIEDSIEISRMMTPGKKTIIDCWASWCGPCRASMPQLAKIHEEYRDKATILSIAVWDDLEDTKEAIEEEEFKWPVVSADMSEYGLEAIPTILVVDENGIITERMTGLDITKLRNALDN